jgi:hypothetical protein
MKKKMEFGPEAAKCKIENRRIRIILLSEDLFSLFVDSSAELKYSFCDVEPKNSVG